MLSKDERAEAFATTARSKEALAEGFGIELGFGIGFSGFVYRGIGQAQDDPANHAQDQSRIGSSHSAMVFLQGDVQAVVQAALNDPVATFELEHAPSLQLRQTQAAEQEDHFAAPLAVALDPGFQASRQPGAWEADLAGRHC